MSKHRIAYQPDPDFAYIEYERIKVTRPKANLYVIHGEEIWLPVSQIEDDSGEIVVIPKWLAKKKGLESDW